MVGMNNYFEVYMNLSKKTAAFVIAFAVFTTAFLINISADSALPPLTGEEGFEEWIDIIPGDINFDGTINSIDSNYMKRCLSGLHSPNLDERAAGDINGDGSVDIMDANYLKRMLSGTA